MADKLKTVDSTCCDDANNILNLSQGTQSHAQSTGHPRYHVLCSGTNLAQSTIISDLPSLDCTDAVTMTMGNTKTAFLSKHEQNKTLHEILRMPFGNEAVNILNKGANEVILKVPMRSLSENRNLQMVRVAEGKRMGQEPAKSAVLILGYHKNKPDGMYVHVKTFYPTNRDVNGSHSIEIK
jgi:hypothetical protein